MNIITVCCALNNSYLGIKYDNKIYTEIIKSDENYHSLYLIPKIQELLKKENLLLSNFNIIGANLGPGSFTGVRVTLSLAKTLSQTLNIPLIGLNTAEILIEAYNKKFFLMDARRDMYYLGTKEKIELIYKNDLKKLNPDDIICDKRCNELYPDAINFEENEKDLGLTMIKLTEEKYLNSKDKNEFNYLNVNANYIQTPPVF